MEAQLLTITIHMVSSVDGIIAKPDNSIAWFDTAHSYEKGSDAPNMDEFLNTIDCYIMGARTYAHALKLSETYGWAYGDKPTFVITNNNWVSDKSNIQFYKGDLTKLVNEQLKPQFKNVWLVGGASLAKDFIQLQLADQLRMSILPIILGEGKPFFHQLQQETLLRLTDLTADKNGMVELCYEIKK